MQEGTMKLVVMISAGHGTRNIRRSMIWIHLWWMMARRAMKLSTARPVYASSVCMIFLWSRSILAFIQGFNSLTSYRQIPWSLETARLDVLIIVSLWNLTGISAALLPRCLSNFRAIGKVWIRLSLLRVFMTRFWDKEHSPYVQRHHYPTTDRG